MDAIYPRGPESVPVDLTRPSPLYRRQVWLAVMGLLLFISVYLALAGWFCWGAYQIIMETVAGQRAPLFGYLLGGCSAFLGLFMLKAVFFIQRGSGSRDHEVTEADQPQLFYFLHRLADEAGAPRPHRVFLSNRVNAAVFYDLSVLSFFTPARKNLEIGLPLVNGLTLGELKAVLAHEFGHFAQRSMAVGRWVYVAQQVASQIVARRDYLDKFLSGLSRFDLRIAWIGWVLSLIVWSIRSLMDSLFSIVVIAQRALSREMEFHADLVAVSLTGSDALVHALYKLQSLDDAWSRTQNFIGTEVRNGRGVKDVFEVQTRMVGKMRTLLDDPEYGALPDIQPDASGRHRLFRKQLARPPQMWATHPENTDREENAKRAYIPAPVDQREAWVLFSDAPQLREQVTAEMLKEVECEPTDLAHTLENLDKYYGARFLNPGYRGAYLGRELTRHAHEADQLIDLSVAGDLDASLAALYPPDLSGKLKALRVMDEEMMQLKGLQLGFLNAPGGVIRHNGQEYRKRELGTLLEAHGKRLKRVRDEVHAHDRLCRSLHRLAARHMGQEWDAYLGGLLSVLHYAEHTLADVEDVRGVLSNVWDVILADGKISQGEIKRLIKTCTEVWTVLENVYRQASEVQLDSSITKRLDGHGWAQVLGEFNLPAPERDNIQGWLEAIDSWFNGTIGPLQMLRSEVLDQLLAAESYVAHKYRAEQPAPMRFGISRVPAAFPRLVPGQERKRQLRLDLWDRFQTADGFVPAFFRFAVAGAIVGSVLWWSFHLIVLKRVPF